jgi:predicted nucleic acid-binding protein
MPVITDTSVLNYLILLDQLALLPALYRRVVIPTVVLAVELPHPDSPASVRAWVEHLTMAPPWLEQRAPTRTPEADLLLLEAGERDAILLAQELPADLVLMDAKDGRKAAARRALTVYGTVGVLTRAAERGLVDLPEMFTRLLTTNVRIDVRILQNALARDTARKAAAQAPPPHHSGDVTRATALLSVTGRRWVAPPAAPVAPRDWQTRGGTITLPWDSSGS